MQNNHKYLSKGDNLKFKTFNWILLFLVFSFAFYTPTVAAVSQLVFTTDPQTIAPRAISDKLTVSSGEAPGETADLALTSSSASGEFLNESGEEFRPTWNSNYKSRTFYYRDATAGVYTITATLATRTSQESRSISQTITVGAGATGTNDDDDDTDDSTAPPTTTGDSSSGNGTLSAHSSPVPTSQVASTLPFKIGAGRVRLASVHSPIVFRAEASGTVPKAVRYRWSFGDGGSAVGEKVTHLYHFPGEYNVVLDASSRDGGEAVARTTASIIQPIVSFGPSLADQVEIINHSTRELNLGGWRVVQGGATFTFPPDTILAVGKNLVVPAIYLGFSPTPTVPLNLTFPDTTIVLTRVNNDADKLTNLNQSLRQLSSELVTLRASQNIKPIKSPVAFTPPVPPVSPDLGGPPVTASIAVIPVPKSPGFFARIKNWFTK